MRLLERDSTGEFRLTKDLGKDDVPPYAILSHTWGDDDEEVTYRDFSEDTGKAKAGYRKIRFCGEQAARDGLQYFWVDTCCIDKTNAVELQSSINSMFRWYKNARKCYVYLSDASIPEAHVGNHSTGDIELVLRAARWFTRGWTLQELLAPSSVEFFSADYKLIGDKVSLEPLIHEITGIPVEALQGYDLTKFSVEERVSWIAKRETKHEEDIAYSLFGFFGIFLPLLYGEGRENAFRRLREEVNRHVEIESPEFGGLPRSGFENQSESTVHKIRNLQIPSRLPARQLRRDGFNLKFHLANVPSIHHFEGRETYIQRLADTLLPESGPTQRKLEIVSGLGGIGKTQLAIQFAKLHENKFSSAFFIDAHSQTSISRTFLGIHMLLWGDCNKQASGIVDEVNMLDIRMISEVLDWFCLDGNTRWLLIFDNVDRQPSDPDGIDITAFFPPANGGSILVTTRLNPLEIDRLSKPQIALQSMSYAESSSLLDYYMNMVPNTSSMTSKSHLESREQQDTLLGRLAGLPLALAQAGSFLRTTKMSITQYLNLYDNSRRQLLESHRPLFGSGDDRTRGSIWTTWSMSISLLRDMTQRAGSGNRYGNALKLLQLISYFDPTDIDFTILRRGLVSNDVPNWFEEVFENELSFITTAEILVERSLLNGTAKYATFSMHRVVYDWLCASNENDDFDEQLLSLAMCAIAFSAPGHRYKAWEQDERRLITHALAMENKLLRCRFISGVPMVDLGTFTSAQRQRALFLVRDPDWYMELNNTHQPLAALTYLFSVFGKRQTCLKIIDAALARSDHGNGIIDTPVYVALLESKAIVLYHQENFEAARACLQSATIRARLHGLQHELGGIILLNALITRREGNPRLAIHMLTQLIQDPKRLGLGIYHPTIITAAIELDLILEAETENYNTVFNVVNERIRLLEPYWAGAEEKPLHDPKVRRLLIGLGMAYHKANATLDATRVLKACLAAELANGAVNTLNLDGLYCQLSLVCFKMDHLEGLEYCEKWLQVRIARNGPNSKKTAEALSDLCLTLQDTRPDDPRALQVGLQAANILVPDDGKEYWRLCARLCGIYNRAKNWEEATTWGRRAVESSASEFGIQSQEYALELQILNGIYEKARNLESVWV